jgi:hypothetical protein
MKIAVLKSGKRLIRDAERLSLSYIRRYRYTEKLIADAERLSLSYIRRYSYMDLLIATRICTDLHGKGIPTKKLPKGLALPSWNSRSFAGETYKFLYLFRKTQIFSKFQGETYKSLCLFRSGRWKPDSSVALKMHKID